MTRDPYYSIIDYRVDGPQAQAAIVSAFAEIQRQWVASYPGYRSARFLTSTDGDRVLCVVTWDSEEDFRHFEAVSDTEGRSAAIGRALAGLSATAERKSFRLARTVKPEDQATEAANGHGARP